MFGLRLFIAIHLPAALSDPLVAAQRALAAAGPAEGVRWTPPANMHLTLQFLGSVAAQSTADLAAACDQAAAGGEPFTLRLAGLGAFPAPARPRVVWAGLAGDLAALYRLQAGVVAATAARGFVAEARLFRPHLTLGRVRQPAAPAEQTALGQALAKVALVADDPWPVHELLLMCSELDAGLPRYTALHRARLG